MHAKGKSRDKLIERANVAHCSGGFAEAVLLRRRYAVMKEATRAADESATRGVSPPGAPPTSPSTVTSIRLQLSRCTGYEAGLPRAYAAAASSDTSPSSRMSWAAFAGLLSQPPRHAAAARPAPVPRCAEVLGEAEHLVRVREVEGRRAVLCASSRASAR